MRDGNLSLARTLLEKCLKFGWGKEIEAVNLCLESLGNFLCWREMAQTASTCTVSFLVHSLKSKRRLETQKALQFLGDVFLAQGDHDTALSLFTLALDGFTQMDVHRGRAECILRLGDIWKLRADILKAVELWKTARPLFERSSQAQQIIQVDERLATISRNEQAQKSMQPRDIRNVGLENGPVISN
jgi:tetratricopeptide (TPR) repeat protein